MTRNVPAEINEVRARRGLETEQHSREIAKFVERWRLGAFDQALDLVPAKLITYVEGFVSS